MKAPDFARRFVWAVALAVAAAALSGCTQNEMARNYGGTSKETLPPGKKLLLVTWKDSNLWLLVRPMRAGETPEVYEFKESSNTGLLNGTVVIQETR